MINIIEKRPGIKWLILSCFIVVFLAAIPVMVNTLIERTIKAKLKALPTELSVTYSTIHSNILFSSITFSNLHVQYQPYKLLSNHHDIQAEKLKVNGIALLKLLLGKTININDVQLGRTEIKLDSLLLSKKDSAQAIVLASIPVPFNDISIHKFSMQGTSIWIHTADKMQLLTKGMLELNDIVINNIRDKNTKQFRFTALMCFLKELHYSSPDYGFSVHTGSVIINSKAGVLEVDSIRLTYSFDGTNNNTYQVSTQMHQIQLKGWNVLNFLERKLTADSLLVDNNKLYVHTILREASVSNPLPALGLRFNFPFVTDIKNIYIQHSDLNYDNIMQATGDIAISDLHGEDQSNAIISSPLHCSAIHATYHHITYYTGTPARVIQINDLSLNSSQAQLVANNLTVHTIYSKEWLANKLGYQADWIDASVKTITLQNPDINALLQSRLLGKRLLLNGVHVYIYRDRRLPRRKVHQPMLADLLKQIPADIRIQTVEVNNATIGYDEMPADGFKTGMLRVENMYASMSPFINHPQKDDPGYTRLYTTASLMGSGSIIATIDMPLKQNVYYAKGAIHNLDLTTLNSSAENLGKFHIQSGMLNNLYFNFSFTAIKSTGKIIGEYHNLVVQKLNKKRKEALFPSLVLRYVIIPKNKDRSRPVAQRTGYINYTRDDTRFISFFLVKSLLTGIRSSFTFGFLLPE